MENQLDIIDKRLRTLESKIFDSDDVKEEFSKSKSILQVLNDSQETLSSALAGQSKIQQYLQSLDKLDAVLDPNYENKFIDLEVKISLILNNHENIIKCANLLSEFDRKKDTVLSENLSKIIADQPNLSKVIDQQIVVKGAVENQTKKISDLMLKYTSFMESLSNYVSLLDKKLTELENAKISAEAE
ncbi:unnamed protein product [Bemisia tabaci]|uniref:Dynactin subunit 3 n=1 Tax=Bemisia tabaci TaxID=7038 RepID=A0A9P0F2G1_BEMTA|nr:unnamed protein product [Bemisia tabaci]